MNITYNENNNILSFLNAVSSQQIDTMGESGAKSTILLTMPVAASTATQTTTTATTTSTTAETTTTATPPALDGVTTVASSSVSTSTTDSGDIDADDITVTRVFGRYMSVDMKQLLKKDELLKKKKLKNARKTLKNNKQMKKHYIPMSLLKPQPPSMDDEEVEVDIQMPSQALPTVNVDAGASATVSKHHQLSDAHDDNDGGGGGGDGNGNGDHHMNVDEMDVIGMYSTNEDILTAKELIDDMARIMKDGAEIRRKSKYATKKGHGACFTGADSFFHYNDAETMRQIISYKIDLNLRFKTHSNNGLILWSGRHTAQDDDDYLLLGIENG